MNKKFVVVVAVAAYLVGDHLAVRRANAHNAQRFTNMTEQIDRLKRRCKALRFECFALRDFVIKTQAVDHRHEACEQLDYDLKYIKLIQHEI